MNARRKVGSRELRRHAQGIPAWGQSCGGGGQGCHKQSAPGRATSTALSDNAGDKAGGRKSEIKVSAGLLSREASLLGT